MEARRVFIAGATGYIGSRLIPELHAHGCEVIALAREHSRAKLPWCCTPVVGDALNGASYQTFAAGADAFVHLVGVSHPSPAKAAQFRAVDLQAGLEAIRVARDAGVGHFVYLSVAQPAPVMREYQAVRAECEQAIAVSGLRATVLRPWYVLGPGHRWPYCLVPFYKVAELIPAYREGALRLGLVTIHEMVRAIVYAVTHPGEGIRVLDVQSIRRIARGAADRTKGIELR